MNDIIPLLYHRAGQTPKQDYSMTMRKLEHEGYTDPKYGYNPNWRQEIKRLFMADGQHYKTEPKDLRSGLLDLKYFKGVTEVWAEFTCPICGDVEYVEWSLDNIDDENLLDKCPTCGHVYELHLHNVHIVKWIKNRR